MNKYPESMPAVIVWFQQDLRIQDNPALSAAIQTGLPVIPIYILEDETPEQWQRGANQGWWLYHSLKSLDQALQSHGSRLILRRGDPETILKEFSAGRNIQGIFWNDYYVPWSLARNKRLKEGFRSRGINVETFNGNLLFEPESILNLSGQPFRVYSHFRKSALKASRKTRKTCLPVIKIPGPEHFPISDKLEEWSFLQDCVNRQGTDFHKHWRPGEEEARQRLSIFLDGAISGYEGGRDIPGKPGTSCLSPYLRHGEISPHQIVESLYSFFPGSLSSDAERFLDEILWREFSYYLLHYFPELPQRAFRPEFEGFRWNDNPEYLRRWQDGMTGYPIVDAGMRELLHTGWMHNRVRMITASFLVKDLLVDWRKGEAWFRDMLLDADLACNPFNWQWVAGCGVDPAPFFRIFNPVLQGEKFDPEGVYVRRWIPELAAVPAKHIHKPWETIWSTGSYPSPVVGHDLARQEALLRYQEIRQER